VVALSTWIFILSRYYFHNLFITTSLFSSHDIETWITNVGLIMRIQWNLSNLTHQRTKEMCQIVQDVGILRFYYSSQKYFGIINIY
jgi:hypothetical protein